MAGATDSIFAIGDCTATSYAPTAQVASQEGAYLARILQQIAKKDELKSRLKELQAAPEAEAKEERVHVEKRLAKLAKIRPFKYSHQGSLAYIGSDRAIADLPFFNGNVSAPARVSGAWQLTLSCSLPRVASRRSSSGEALTSPPCSPFVTVPSSRPIGSRSSSSDGELKGILSSLSRTNAYFPVTCLASKDPDASYRAHYLSPSRFHRQILDYYDSTS